MRGYSHLTAAERDRIADLKAAGQSVRAIAQALGRSRATISRELRRNALASGAYRPTIAEGSYLLRRQRPAVLERDPALAGYVTDRLAEGWTPEQIAGRLKRGVERGLRYVSTETIYAWIFRPGQKPAQLWRYLPRGKAKRGRRQRRTSKDRIADKTHLSERIGGETWSGITRHYRISPMVPGDFVSPAQDVVVTWNDPASGDAERTVLRTELIAFSGVLPAGAEGLDPFIVAHELELVQAIDGSPEAMRPGDSVTRTLTATVRGVSPMFLPPLLPLVTIEGVAAYPDEPVLAEREERGMLAGTRQESVTLVAEAGGSGEVPAVSVDWYNLETGAVETASVEGFALAVDGPPATRSAPRDWRAIGLALAAGLVALALLIPLARRGVPPLRRWLAGRRAAWLACEAYAWLQLRRAMARRDHAALRPALDRWAGRVEGDDPRRDPDLQAALAALGAARYAAGNGGDPAAA